MTGLSLSLYWLDDDLRVSRSIDDGRTWTPGTIIARDAACDDCSPLRHFSRLQMTHDRAGRWVLVFASLQISWKLCARRLPSGRW